VRFALAGDEWFATAEELGITATVDGAIAEAMHSSAGADVTVDAAGSSAGLRHYVERLDRKLARAPRDARVVRLDARLRPVITREVAGRRIDVPATTEAIRVGIRSAARVPVRPVFTAVRPRVRRADFGAIVVIRRESKTLHLYDGTRLVQRLGVATGTARYPTPLGIFEIVDKQYHPWWYPPASDWAKELKPVPPGPGNPLGTRWMGLNVYGVGIHGTPDAASIGYSASHGCIRMHIWEAEWLFQRVRLGTPVVIVSA
jgi:lipoprotein-anchoring transpeptidase ErfK/SrfK